MPKRTPRRFQNHTKRSNRPPQQKGSGSYPKNRLERGIDHPTFPRITVKAHNHEATPDKYKYELTEVLKARNGGILYLSLCYLEPQENIALLY